MLLSWFCKSLDDCISFPPSACFCRHFIVPVSKGHFRINFIDFSDPSFLIKRKCPRSEVPASWPPFWVSFVSSYRQKPPSLRRLRNLPMYPFPQRYQNPPRIPFLTKRRNPPMPFVRLNSRFRWHPENLFGVFRSPSFAASPSNAVLRHGIA